MENLFLRKDEITHGNVSPTPPTQNRLRELSKRTKVPVAALPALQVLQAGLWSSPGEIPLPFLRAPAGQQEQGEPQLTGQKPSRCPGEKGPRQHHSSGHCVLCRGRVAKDSLSAAGMKPFQEQSVTSSSPSWQNC